MQAALSQLWGRLASGVGKYLPRVALPEPVLLHTPRLLLRDFLEEDAPALYTLRRDPEVTRYLDRTGPLTEREAWWLIYVSRAQMWQPRREHFNLAVVEPETGRLLGEGCLGLLFPDEQARAPDAATLGFIIRRECWGRGYATEVGEALLRFGFREVGLQTVYGGCHPENAASRRVLEKLGLRFHGAQEEFPGSPEGVAALVFRLDREEWDERAALRGEAPVLEERGANG